MRYAALLTIPVMLLAVTSCFTGVESTPKITAGEVKRQQVTVTEEDRFLGDVVPERFDKWESGKQFYVTDDRIQLALEAGHGAPPKAGDIIAFKNYRTVTSLTGTDDTELVFTTPSGEEVVYRIGVSPADLSARPRVEVPFAIEMSVVDATRSHLDGRHLYIRTPVWYDQEGNSRNGLKYIPVTITDVTPGNTVYPVRVHFVAEHDNIADSASVYMNVGDQSHYTRNFAALFNFDDPHKQYPAISDATWDNITRGKVERYMTRDECRMALGAPDDIRRRNAISTVQEMWYYNNGIYLIFEDGLLYSVRR